MEGAESSILESSARSRAARRSSIRRMLQGQGAGGRQMHAAAEFTSRAPLGQAGAPRGQDQRRTAARALDVVPSGRGPTCWNAGGRRDEKTVDSQGGGERLSMDRVCGALEKPGGGRGERRLRGDLVEEVWRRLEADEASAGAQAEKAWSPAAAAAWSSCSNRMTSETEGAQREG